MRTTRLIRRKLDDSLFLLTNIPDTGGGHEHDKNQVTQPDHLFSRPVSGKEFLHDVHTTAKQLPEGKFAINLCANRYAFAVVFCAVIAKNQTNLLPQNRTVRTQDALIERYKHTYVIHDELLELSKDAPSVAISIPSQPERQANRAIHNINPEIPLDHIAAIAFTSGTTGEPKANIKTWRCFTISTDINARYMLKDANTLTNALATVLPQHMWGLETSVLLPLRHPLCVSDAKPLFPADIKKHLAQLPLPRCFISTPVHLRALLRSGLNFPRVQRTLCATSPLTKKLAADIEAAFNGEVVEIYGCSEIGSMSSRQSAHENEWALFDGISLDPISQANIFEASAAHLPQKTILQDHLIFVKKNRFKLMGREADLIEIAGKRGSLAALNNILLEIDGVIDGVVFIPKSKRMVVRPAALIVANSELNKRDIAYAFSQKVDPVFSPRPIHFIDALPREENGKLTQKTLQSLVQCVT